MDGTGWNGAWTSHNPTGTSPQPTTRAKIRAMRQSDDMPKNNGHGDSGGRKANIKLWLAGALGIYLLLFVLANTDPVDVSFVFFQAKEIGLIWVMLLVAVIAFAIGWVMGRSGRGKKKD